MAPDSKLNIVWDIDHTLIFALEKSAYPHLAKEQGEFWGKNLHTLRLQGNYEMWLIVRFGVQEALEYLSKFCNFYAYSHGLHHYIQEILKLIDPEQKYFKNRDQTVLAPQDQAEQARFVRKQKGINDFTHPDDRSKTLISAEEINKTLIVDDQYAAIRDNKHLVISKKFLKYCQNSNVPQNKRIGWAQF